MEGWLLLAKLWAWAVVAACTIAAFAAFAIVASLLVLALAVACGHRRARRHRAALDDPDHPVLLFPPCQGL